LENYILGYVPRYTILGEEPEDIAEFDLDVFVEALFG